MILIDVLLGIFKSVRLNFKYLPLKQAVKFPIIVSRYTKLKKLQGKITINSPIKTGMILIGIGNVGIIDNRYTRSILEFGKTSNIIFNGSARFGNGTKISNSGIISFGNNFCITARSDLVCCESMKFGDDCLVSWDCLIMDTDFHKVYKGNKVGDVTRKIVLGNNVWVGCRTLILKGSSIPDGSVIGAGSTVGGTFEKENTIILNESAKVKFEDIRWER